MLPSWMGSKEIGTPGWLVAGAQAVLPVDRSGSRFGAPGTIESNGYGSRLNQETAGFGAWLHLPGFHFGIPAFSGTAN